MEFHSKHFVFGRLEIYQDNIVIFGFRYIWHIFLLLLKWRGFCYLVRFLEEYNWFLCYLVCYIITSSIHSDVAFSCLNSLTLKIRFLDAILITLLVYLSTSYKSQVNIYEILHSGIVNKMIYMPVATVGNVQVMWSLLFDIYFCCFWLGFCLWYCSLNEYGLMNECFL